MASTILLHICCGICASVPAQRLAEQGYEVVGLFYNPNIYPYDEYMRRCAVARDVAQKIGFRFIEGPYDKDDWVQEVAGLEHEQEGGRRCALCFKMRLEYANEKRQELGLVYFTTTLSVSPHKDARIINDIGTNVDAAHFLECNFKKAGGFQQAMAFAKDNGLYRQHYCGCQYGMTAQGNPDTLKKP